VSVVSTNPKKDMETVCSIQYKGISCLFLCVVTKDMDIIIQYYTGVQCVFA